MLPQRIEPEDAKQYSKAMIRFLSNPLLICECPTCKNSFIDRQSQKLRNFTNKDISREYDAFTKYFSGNRKRATVKHLNVPHSTYHFWYASCVGRPLARRYYYLYRCSACGAEFNGPSWYETYYPYPNNAIFGVSSIVLGTALAFFFSPLIGILAAVSSFILLWIAFAIIWHFVKRETEDWVLEQNRIQYNQQKACERMEQLDKEELLGTGEDEKK